MATKQVQCFDCNQLIPLPEGVGPGDFIGCPNCAGLELRIKQRDGKLVAEGDLTSLRALSGEERLSSIFLKLIHADEAVGAIVP